jgi:membrane protein implicated in regulation of membrane protease activity
MRIWIGLGILLIVVWALLWLVFRILAWTVHLLVFIGLILLLYGLLRRGARQVRGRFGDRTRDEPAGPVT